MPKSCVLLAYIPFPRLSVIASHAVTIDPVPVAILVGVWNQFQAGVLLKADVDALLKISLRAARPAAKLGELSLCLGAFPDDVLCFFVIDDGCRLRSVDIDKRHTYPKNYCGD